VCVRPQHWRLTSNRRSGRPTTEGAVQSDARGPPPSGAGQRDAARRNLPVPCLQGTWASFPRVMYHGNLARIGFHMYHGNLARIGFRSPRNQHWLSGDFHQPLTTNKMGLFTCTERNRKLCCKRRGTSPG